MDRKDPSFIRDPGREAIGYRVLDEATIVQLDQLRRTLQIIVVALVLGVGAFLGYTIIANQEPTSFFGPDRMDFMLAFGAISAVSSIVAPMLSGQTSRGGTQNAQRAMQTMLTGETDHDNAIIEAQRIQMTTIISCANLEGGAFANVVALMMTQDLCHLLVAAVLVVGILLRFPTRSRYLQRIDHACENARLKQLVK